MNRKKNKSIKFEGKPRWKVKENETTESELFKFILPRGNLPTFQLTILGPSTEINPNSMIIKREEEYAVGPRQRTLHRMPFHQMTTTGDFGQILQT
jgi:hypothetical protein